MPPDPAFYALAQAGIGSATRRSARLLTTGEPRYGALVMRRVGHRSTTRRRRVLTHGDRYGGICAASARTRPSIRQATPGRCSCGTAFIAAKVSPQAGDRATRWSGGTPGLRRFACTPQLRRVASRPAPGRTSAAQVTESSAPRGCSVSSRARRLLEPTGAFSLASAASSTPTLGPSHTALSAPHGKMAPWQRRFSGSLSSFRTVSRV